MFQRERRGLVVVVVVVVMTVDMMNHMFVWIYLLCKERDSGMNAGCIQGTITRTK
jgi:hypothetical protein